METKVKRLLKYLAHIKKYPTSLRAASVVSGLTEDQVNDFINNISQHMHLFAGNDLICKINVMNDGSSIDQAI